MRMGQSCVLITLCISVFCLLADGQLAQSTENDNNDVDSYKNYIYNHIFGRVNLSKSFSGFEALHTNQITNSLKEIIHVEEDVTDDKWGIKYLYEFQDYLNGGPSQMNALLLGTTLNKVDKQFDKWRRLKREKLANQVPLFGSPFQGCSKSPYPTSDLNIVKKYEINLDANPEDRWTEVVKQNIDQMKKLADTFEDVLGPVKMSVVNTLLTWLHHRLPSEYLRELNGLSTAPGISVAQVTLCNVFYEISTVCTSIVMEAEDGKMYHGRNLDFGMLLGWDAKNHTWLLTEILRPLIIKVDFLKNGKPLYSAVTYAGYTGILTGVKKNAFSLTINLRSVMNGGSVGLAEWIVGLRDSSWLGLLTRRVMETATSYDEAQQMLAQTPLIAPVYFILAGNSSHQGSVVTRGRKDADIWPLGSRHEQQRGPWFLVQTNHDHWKQTPSYDHRRQYAVQCMDELGQEIPLETLYRVLSTRPVLNKETTLTAVMDVREGRLDVWKRDCADPCWPF